MEHVSAEYQGYDAHLERLSNPDKAGDQYRPCHPVDCMSKEHLDYLLEKNSVTAESLKSDRTLSYLLIGAPSEAHFRILQWNVPDGSGVAFRESLAIQFPKLTVHGHVPSSASCQVD